MSPTAAPLLLVLVLLTGEAALAQPAPLRWEEGTLHVELSAERPEEPVPLSIRQGGSTAVLFDAKLRREGVVLQGREDFDRVLVDEATIVLVSSRRLRTGEKRRLELPYEDGAAPARVVFLLEVDEVHGAQRVEVHRRARSAESFREDLKVREAQVLECKAENERLRAERQGPPGLAGALVARSLDEKGVASLELPVKQLRPVSKSLRLRRGFSYQAKGRVLLELELETMDTEGVWTLGGFELEDRTGQRLKPVEMWQEAPPLPGGTGRWRVVLEAEAPAEAEAHNPYSLRMWAADGRRAFSLGGIQFPALAPTPD